MVKLFTVNTNGKFSDFDDDCKLAAVEQVESVHARGDILLDKHFSYRNEGKMIFDGQEWQDLCDDVDKYGSLPHWVCYPDFPLGSHAAFIAHNNICWVKIDEKIIEEISALKVVEVDASHVKETVDIEGNFFYIKGVLCGKSVHWDLDECEEDWQARACLQNLQNLVKNFSEAHLALHFDSEAGVVTGFAAVRADDFHTIAIEQLQDGEDF